MNARLLTTLLALAALIHLLPLPGLLGGPKLALLYGLPALDAASEILLRHRALMFGLDAALLLWSIRSAALRGPAIALTLASDAGFLLLCLAGLPAGLLKIAIADALSIAALLGAWALLARAGRSG